MKRIVIRYGLVMFLSLLGFFLIMHALNLSLRYNLRIFNGVIHLWIIALAINQYGKIRPYESDNYMGGVATGVLTSMVGVLMFSIFQIIHLALNDSFMQYLRDNVPYVGEYLTPYTAGLTIFMEGLAVSVIGSYIITRIIYAAKENKADKVTGNGSNSVSNAQEQANISAAKASSNAERASLN